MRVNKKSVFLLFINVGSKASTYYIGLILVKTDLITNWNDTPEFGNIHCTIFYSYTQDNVHDLTPTHFKCYQKIVILNRNFGII